MQYDNDAKQIKFEVLKKVAQLSFEGKLEEKLDNIPYEIIPGNVPKFRCCVYKEREIIRERVSVARGRRPASMQEGEEGVVGVLPAACEGCPINRFTVTANCQRCMAKKCVAACPFGAITVTGKGAYIDPAKCKECGRCAAACPYNAISDTMRPCLRSCPVDAITMDTSKLAKIRYDRCIGCGACTAACPFGAITDSSSLTQVIEEMKGPREVYAVFAPAMEGQFGLATVGMLKTALRELGFTGAYEVSLGADAVAQHEAEELKEAIQNGTKLTTSCCPAFVAMIEKHFPRMMQYVSHTVSPLAATARFIKTQKPDAVVVFVGPCIAKKQEIKKMKDTADYVLTFEELVAMFEARGIDPAAMAENEQDGSRYGKGFAVSGGVSGAVARVLEEENVDITVTCKRCNGAKECKKALMILNAGRLPEDIMEGMACEGGCIAGPAGISAPGKTLKNREKLIKDADERGITENVEQHDFSKVNMNAERV